VGAVLLVWIAVKLVRQEGPGEHGKVREGTTVYEAIWIIVVADLIMSLDNVLGVAGAAHGDFLLVAMGIGLSIPIVIWGSGLLAGLMNRFPQIVWLGAGVLGWVAGEMFVKDPIVHSYIEPVYAVLEYGLRVGLAAGLVLLAWTLARRAQRRAVS
jgi:YjbE family integral membrane protein